MVCPVSVPPPGFTAIVNWTTAPRTELPKLSITSTFTDGVICVCDCVLLGCAAKETVKREATVNVYEALAFCCGVPESAAWTVNEKMPVVLDVPLTTPAALMVIPGGKDPLATDQVTGPVPPVVLSTVL